MLILISKVILLYKKDDPVIFLIIDQFYFYLYISSDKKEFTLNHKLQYVNEWLLANTLQLNVKKNTCCFISKTKQLTN